MAERCPDCGARLDADPPEPHEPWCYDPDAVRPEPDDEEGGEADG